MVNNYSVEYFGFNSCRGGSLSDFQSISLILKEITFLSSLTLSPPNKWVFHYLCLCFQRPWEQKIHLWEKNFKACKFSSRSRYYFSSKTFITPKLNLKRILLWLQKSRERRWRCFWSLLAKQPVCFQRWSESWCFCQIFPLQRCQKQGRCTGCSQCWLWGLVWVCPALKKGCGSPFPKAWSSSLYCLSFIMSVGASQCQSTLCRCHFSPFSLCVISDTVTVLSLLMCWSGSAFPWHPALLGHVRRAISS